MIRKLISIFIGMSILTTPLSYTSKANAFGLEMWATGKRYHYDMATSSLQHRGLPAHVIAWNDDGLDMYLNTDDFTGEKIVNAILPKPAQVAICVQPPLAPLCAQIMLIKKIKPPANTADFRAHLIHDWERLHFDELSNANAVINQWERYVYGALYGLIWAAEEYAQETDSNRKKGLLLAAYNILGVTMHAFEDFYSHSTWINKLSHRGSTPGSGMTAVDSRRKDVQSLNFTLYTGWYHHSSTHFKPHGKAICVPLDNHTAATLLTGPTIFSLLSPSIQDAITDFLEKNIVSAARFPDGGINVDRLCSAELAISPGHGREPDWETPKPSGGKDAMQHAIELAKKTTETLLTRLKDWMTINSKHKDTYTRFWQALEQSPVAHGIQTPKTGDGWAESFFDYRYPYALSMRPTGFLAGGDNKYPIMNSIGLGSSLPKSGRWMFRVLLESKKATHFIGTTGKFQAGDITYNLENLITNNRNAWSMAFYVGGENTKALPTQFKLSMSKGEFTVIEHVQVYAYWIGAGADKIQFGKIIDSQLKHGPMTLGQDAKCSNTFCEWTLPTDEETKPDLDLGFTIDPWGSEEPKKPDVVGWWPSSGGTNTCSALNPFAKCRLPTSTHPSCPLGMVMDSRSGHCTASPTIPIPSQPSLSSCFVQMANAYIGQNLTNQFPGPGGWSGKFAVWIYQQCGRRDVEWGIIGPQGYGPRGAVHLVHGTTGMQPGDIVNYTDGNRFGIVERIDGNQAYVIQGDRFGRVVGRDVWTTSKIYGYYRTNSP